MSTAIQIKHNEAAEEWATSADRAVVFSVVKANPEHDPEAALPEGVEAPPAEVQVDYTMPAKPNAGLALRYLKMARQNADFAFSWLLETALGEEGYDALTEELETIDDPAEAQKVMQGVTERIQRVALGGLEGPKA